MIHAYSKRLLSPFLGQVQVVETAKARALSLDGKNWEIQYLHGSGARRQGPRERQDRVRRDSYARVACIRGSEIGRHPTLPFLDVDEVEAEIDGLAAFLADPELPFPPADHLEYWLLDGRDQAPLALLYACVSRDEMSACPSEAVWTALSAAEMEIEALPEERQGYTPPVNYRLQQLVAERAGRRPRARWFTRRPGRTDDFPPCLLAEDWADQAQRELCRRYICRLAPRLLTLHGLDRADRQRLEIAARQHACEVDRFYPLYPDVVDQRLMKAIRVEASLRRAQGP